MWMARFLSRGLCANSEPNLRAVSARAHVAPTAITGAARVEKEPTAPTSVDEDTAARARAQARSEGPTRRWPPATGAA